ncbi:MAG: Ig-like domain-containing protein, partial [Planctomycetota bacterium]
SGVDAATNASTAGTQEYLGDPLSVWLNTGNNHDEGYLARWSDIDPGADGSFTVRAEAHPTYGDGIAAYAFDVFMLQEFPECLQALECDDGLFCSGVETCGTNGLCQSSGDPCSGQGQLCRESDDQCLDCFTAGDCDDGLYCNGSESCDTNGLCQPGTDPCPGLLCRESDDQCVDCLVDGDCDDGDVCDGIEVCTNGLCAEGPLPDCSTGGCTDCNSNGLPDECDIADCPPANPSCQDCDSNGVPDECDVPYPHQGRILLDRSRYACEAAATIQVDDCGLNTDDNSVESVVVTISSDSEPSGETVLLTETGQASESFQGTVTLSETDGTGVLLVAHGDTAVAEYVDADDGLGGTNLVVTVSVGIDCDPPTISNVQTVSVEPKSATVGFETDQGAYGTVRYGFGCAALSDSVTDAGLNTVHTVNLTGLTEDATYFYAVEAEDEAGNTASDDNGGICYTFTTPDVTDFFTEQYGLDNDLDNLTLLFTPDAPPDFYAGCADPITSLPTDPSGGTAITLADDAFAQIALSGGQTVSLYGVSYSSFYVGSNGYITFTGGDSDYDETLAEHFSLARISALYDDFDPSARGLVSWKQLADRAVVTYENVPEYETSNSNTFQVEMYFNGDVRISYLDIDALGGIAGLSEGNGLDPDFYETDLSTMGACGPRPPRGLSGEAGTAVDMPVTIALTASDDGLPDPPAELTFIVTSLPGSGELTDPGSGLILGVPHTLAGNGNQAMYQPDAGYAGTDNFQFKANDGGTPPDGGDSNDATMTVTIGGPAWDPLAYDVQASAQISTPKNVPLLASDPNGDPLTYYIQSLPSAGTLSDPGAGAIGTVPYELVGGGDVVTYQPPAGQNLQTLFDFSVRDATAASNVASVTVTVGGPQVVYYFALDSDPGWSTEGDWAFGQPAGAGGANGGPDPTSGHTGNNEYGYNLAGDYA